MSRESASQTLAQDLGHHHLVALLGSQMIIFSPEARHGHKRLRKRRQCGADWFAEAIASTTSRGCFGNFGILFRLPILPWDAPAV